MITNRQRLVLAACLGLAACGTPGSYTMDDCRQILAAAGKPGTQEDAGRRQAERTCANIVSAPPAAAKANARPAGAASAPRAG